MSQLQPKAICLDLDRQHRGLFSAVSVIFSVTQINAHIWGLNRAISNGLALGSQSAIAQI
jgi:hypothetical protein